MNKFITKLAKVFLGLSLAAGVGVAIGSNRKASSVEASYVESYSANFTTVSAHSYTQNKTFTLSSKSWTSSVSQVNSSVFYLGCNSNNASKGVLNNNSTFSAVVTALKSEDATYNSNYTTAHAYALLFNNAYSKVTKVEFNWAGGNNAFQVYLFGDSGSGFEKLNSTNYATSGTSVSGSVTWTGDATNYTKFAIVARPGATGSTATNKTLRASTFKIYTCTPGTITASEDSVYSDESVTLTSNANTATWSITSGLSYAHLSSTSGKSVTLIGDAAGSVTVKAVATEYLDATKTIVFNERPAGTYYTVTYNPNSGTVSPTSELIIEDGHPTFPTPTRGGYNFKGWQVNGSGTAYTDSEDYTVTGDVTFVASWVAVYTVTFNANGGSSTPASKSIEVGSTFTFPSAGTKTHYSFSGWKSPSDSNLYAVGATSPSVTAAITYTAQWTPDAQYNVTYTAGDGGSGSFVDKDQWSGSYTLKAFANLTGVSESTGYRFKNYTVGGVAKNPGDTVTLSAATAVTVNFELIPPSDTLTATLIGRTSYGDWSGVSTGASDAVYAGNSTKSSSAGAIQMRSSNSNSGIVTTTSGGTIASITVTWNKTEAPTTARTLDIYAKTTAYSAATDLYDSSTQGTKVGSLSYTNTTTYVSTFTFTGDYTYVGVRSNSGALYLDDITFEWELPNQLSSIVISGYEDEFDSGDTFSFGGTVTAKYTKASDATVTSSATFHLDSASGTSMTGVTLTHAAHDGHTIYVKYTEDGVTKTATYEISVANAPVTSVTITIHAAEIGLEEDYSVSGIETTVLPADAVQTTEWVVSANTVSNDYTWDGTKLTSGNTEGTVTLRCRSTADNSKYDEIIVDITGNPVAEFAKDSTSGYAGKSETVSFMYGNFDAEDIVIASGNTSYVTIGTVSAEHGSGSVVINFVAAGSTSVTIGDGNSTLDTLTVTVSADGVKTVTWSASNINVYSGATLSTTGWNVQYEMDSGDIGSASNYIIKLGSATVTAGYAFQASDDGKTMHVEYEGVSSSSISVSVTQSLRPVLKPLPGEESTKTWTATAAANLGAVISNVNDTDSGTVSFDDDSTMSYERTLEFVATGKADYIAFSNNYIQLGSSNALEKVVFTAATSGTVKSIDIDCWSKDGAVTVSATVGGNAFGSSQSTPSAKDSTPVNFSGSASGNVVITFEKSTKTAGNAQYIKSIAITIESESSESVNIANVAGHEAAQKAVVKFAKAFNAAMDNTLNCTTGLSSAWSTATSHWNTFLSEAAALGSAEEAYAKDLIKYATARWTADTDENYEYCLERALATYEKCVNSHGQTAFMSAVRSVSASHVSPLINIIGENTNTIAIIVIISMVSVTAIGGYFFLRKRKENI